MVSRYQEVRNLKFTHDSVARCFRDGNTEGGGRVLENCIRIPSAHNRASDRLSVAVRARLIVSHLVGGFLVSHVFVCVFVSHVDLFVDHFRELAIEKLTLIATKGDPIIKYDQNAACFL